MPKPLHPGVLARADHDSSGKPVDSYDARTHPSYNLGRGFIPLDSTGARKKYVKAPV